MWSSKEAQREYYQKNKARITEQARKFREAHPERVREYAKKAYYNGQKEKQAKRKKELYQQNREKINAYYRKRYVNRNKKTIIGTVERGLFSGNWSIEIPQTRENETALLEYRLRKLNRICEKARIKSLRWLGTKKIYYLQVA